ncbi:MAG: 2-C-methyl-D-erythritol 4-phosphate cytidylyltransferase [Phycisphaerae bacterium]
MAPSSSHPFGIIIPAAGSGTRFGGGDKLLTALGSQTVLQRSVALFVNRPDVSHLILVTARDRFATYQQHLSGVLEQAQRARGNAGPVVLTLVEGGRERWESVLLGLRALPANVDYVGIHDAARPLTPAAVIDAAFAGALRHGGSVPCVAEPATLKRTAVGEGYDRLVTATVDRAGLYQAQTPQCFKRAQLLAAYESLLAAGTIAGVTDDAQIFEKAGLTVAATLGAATNLKITTPEDVKLAQALVQLDGFK